MDTPVGHGTLGDLIVVLVVISILILFAVFCFVVAFKLSKGKKEFKGKQEKRRAELSAIEVIYVGHMAGLPIPEGVFCNIFLCPDKYIFEYNNHTFNLSFEKVDDVVIKSETEIQHDYVSSAGGAVGGALLFGPLGAMVGGRTKKMTTTITRSYLIFTYQKEGAPAFLSFGCAGDSKTLKYVKAFQVLNKEKVSTDL